MIENEQQKERTLIQIENLRSSLSSPASSQVDPRLVSAARLQVMGLIEELEEQIKEYESRKLSK